MALQLCMMCSKILRGKNVSCATLLTTHVHIHACPTSNFIQNYRSINPIYLIWLRILYYNTSVYLLSTTTIECRAFPLIIYIFTNTYIVTKPHFLCHLFSEYAWIPCRCLHTSLLNKSHLPPTIHKIPSINIHASIQHSIKTQNLTQLTTFPRQKHIQRTMWGQSNKPLLNGSTK